MNWRGRVLLAAAHPDDEVIGAGGHLGEAGDIWLVHGTDGAPRDMRDATALGFARREDYAQARREELLEALRLAGIGAERALGIGLADQEAAFHLNELTRRFRALFLQLRPDVILAPTYEGGHPDHDSVAFAVHAAQRMLAPDAEVPAIVEYTLYHRGPNGIETGAFLPDSGRTVEKIALSGAARERKQRMMACFVTQQRVLEAFSTGYECFRPAPAYDFAAPPHDGLLFYEQFPWGVDGRRWRQLAREAMAQVGAHSA